jgi:hypothetical protein
MTVWGAADRRPLSSSTYIEKMNELLVAEIAAELRRHGSVRSNQGEPTADWRAAARAAARELGRPIETVEHQGIAHAVLRDWPANELEREVQRKALHRAVRAASK